MNKYKLNFSDISNELSFFDSIGSDRYFCHCGGFLKKEQTEEDQKTSNAEIDSKDEEFSSIIESFKLHGKEGVSRCPSCGNNFSYAHTNKKLIRTETYFVSGYKLEEDEIWLKLYYSKVKSIAIPRLSNDNNKDMDIIFAEELNCISFNKNRAAERYRSSCFKTKSR